MDRNNVIGFVLLGILIVVFFVFQSRDANRIRLEQAKIQHTEDSIKNVKRIADSIYLVNNPVKVDTGASAIITTSALIPDSLKRNLSAEALIRLEDSIKLSQKNASFGPFASVMQGTEKADSIENDFIKIVFNSKGGSIQRAELKKYKNYDGGVLDVIGGDKNRFNYNFYYADNKVINTEELYFTANKTSDGKSITFTADLGNGSALQQIYAFTGTDYLIDYNLKLTEFQQIIPGRDPIIILNWKNEMQEQEKNIKYERQYSKLYFSTADGDVDYKNTNGEIKFESPIKWVSCQQQFFNSTLIAKDKFENKGKIDVYMDEDSTDYVKRCNTELYITFNNKSTFDFPMQWYLAPNDYQNLNALDIGLETIIPTGSGFIGWINTFAIIPLFNWLSSFIGNYGLIILLMTLILKLALTPLTYRSYLSMAKMRVLNPEVAEIREKYKDDQAKLGQEQLKLFRKAGVNPLGGCIPTLLSMPILIAMFRLFPGSIELRQQSFLWADDLSSYDDIIRWSNEIPFIGNHISIFCILMTISSVMYIRMNMQNTTQLTGPMKTIQYITPIFFFFFLNSSPAGLTYYYFVSNLVTFGQQWSIRRFFINDDEIHRRIQENKAKPEKQKSGFAKRLEDAMRQQQAMKSNKEQQTKKKK
ncbi:MAG: membrane protein insertase YidC [Chitinophagales bacterium]|jgi:YidC/Oxa1 family membrane protein insertase|nr:membrane protein insertase YidC [Bacteroidota bacterium]MBK7567688.1 membrane protein insertase YidC [Bacteroidota bacterium]MBP8915455.1 membrane protein insertase YidC [Chitinophagales bacterium]MBP9220201.1 membrane protein insertase YidC [Chitinophagales bacterium]MBP9795155.1 membrane protein insertase YidC [Chitinophagales bacterium]